jgi:multiple sugar transport system ATP-binding protein
VRTAAFALPLPSRLRDRVQEGQKVIVGLRPEHIAHVSEPARGTTVTIPATVDVLEPIGHESIVYATAGSERLVAIFEPHITPRAGETIELRLDADALHLFDATTEMAVG